MINFTKAFAILVLLMYAGYANAQVTLATWTFANNSLNDTVQNGTLPLNLNAAIRTVGTATITMTNGQITGDYAATATGWDNGADQKNWNLNIATTGYENITLSSKQRSGNTNAGPINWKVQYKVGVSGIWTDLTGGTVTAGNDWTSGVLSNVVMPVECANISQLYIRWIMTTNIGVGGGNVGAAGTSKIDDIVIKGTSMAGVEETLFNTGILFYPNPVQSTLNIVSKEWLNGISIYNISGQCVYTSNQKSKEISVDVTDFKSGLYVIKTVDENNVIRAQKIQIL